MGLIVYLFIGLIAGAVAKALFRGTGTEPSGLFGTICLGIVGAAVSGWAWHLLLGMPAALDFGSVLAASIGAVLTLGILKLIRH